MRISDWSSDACSSDLLACRGNPRWRHSAYRRTVHRPRSRNGPQIYCKQAGGIRRCLPGQSARGKRRMTSIVLDASALLAMLRDEPGGDKVADVLNGSHMCVVNLDEVPSHFVTHATPSPEKGPERKRGT